jgi:hypothetical protein
MPAGARPPAPARPPLPPDPDAPLDEPHAARAKKPRAKRDARTPGAVYLKARSSSVAALVKQP